MLPNMLPIEVRNVNYSPSGRAVLRKVDLTIEKTGITVVLGPNGAGKSVLLQLLAGLLTPDNGTVLWHGKAKPAHRIAVMFQQPMILRASVRANVAVALKPVVLSRLARRQRIDDALTLVGLAHRARDRAQLLSGGERQRLALARAWAMDSTLMLLDEPTAALDPSGVDAIERIIGEIARGGATVVMTTHSLAQAMRIADRIIFIANGSALEHRTAEQFFQRPESIEGQLYIRAQLPWQTPNTP